MKMFAATAVLALAAMTAPAALGQSQAMPMQLGAANPELVQVKSKPLAPSGTTVKDFERSAGTGNEGFSITNSSPSPAVSWLMALAFLGLVALRRTRSSF